MIPVDVDVFVYVVVDVHVLVDVGGFFKLDFETISPEPSARFSSNPIERVWRPVLT